MIDADSLERLVTARDRELDNEFPKDAQLTAVRNARSYGGDRLYSGRTAGHAAARHIA